MVPKNFVSTAEAYHAVCRRNLFTLNFAEPCAGTHVNSLMVSALFINWDAVLLAVVVCFIVLCVLVSLILKELYRRQ